MNTLKLKFKMADAKENTVSIKNAKETASQADIKALGNYIATNSMLNYAGNKVLSFVGAVMIDSRETKISAE